MKVKLSLFSMFKLIPTDHSILSAGILFSAHDSGDSKIEGATHLPVLLARGPITVRNKVHECLTAVFSSAIHEVSFPPEEMQWMIAAWSGFLNESQKNKEVNFLYGLPAKADTIQCQYSVNFIKDLWRWLVIYVMYFLSTILISKLILTQYP